MQKTRGHDGSKDRARGPVHRRAAPPPPGSLWVTMMMGNKFAAVGHEDEAEGLNGDEIEVRNVMHETTLGDGDGDGDELLDAENIDIDDELGENR